MPLCRFVKRKIRCPFNMDFVKRKIVLFRVLPLSLAEISALEVRCFALCRTNATGRLELALRACSLLARATLELWALERLANGERLARRETLSFT